MKLLIHKIKLNGELISFPMVQIVMLVMENMLQIRLQFHGQLELQLMEKLENLKLLSLN
jgi:hypothetical protein